MCRDLPGGRSIGLQQTGGSAMCGISRVTAERQLQGVADDRVNASQRFISG
jgi:hypothetical protein